MKNKHYIVCKVCNEKVIRIYGAHLKKHNMTSEDYKKMFPGEPLTCLIDKKNTIKNSGLHMKDDKYKKMFSEKIKGNRNPNHKSNTTVQERKERSPFSIEFHKNKKDLIKFREKAFKNRKHTTRLDYYIDDNLTLEESKIMLKERQTTFTLDKCIDKYGEEKGIKIYTERQEKWQKSLLGNGNLKCGYSKISQELFYSILDRYDIDDREKVHFATKDQEYFISLKGGIFYQYDFTDTNKKKIIEYNGDQYHANPKIFESNNNPHPFRKGITAQNIWDKDKEKLKIAKNNGFEVLVIWDSDYKKNKEKTIKNCLSFLSI